MVYGRTMYNLSHILTRYTHMDYNSQVIKGPPPMHMDEQDFQAYIDASVDSSELQNDAEEDEYLTRCVVDVATRKFYLHSNFGDERIVDCDNMDEFMAVLELVRRITPSDMLSYSNPL
jgi:hypothetical protein